MKWYVNGIKQYINLTYKLTFDVEPIIKSESCFSGREVSTYLLGT